MSGESSSENAFESTEGNISDIEDQSIALSVPTSAPLPIAIVNTPTICSIQPTAVLSSPLTLFGLSTMSTTNTVTLVDGYKVKVAATPKTIDANTEYMQISSADRVQLTQKEQTDVRNAITKKHGSHLYRS
jgi:spore germination protein YaaH